jgi:uncharacterized protein (TIGR03089 family)
VTAALTVADVLRRVTADPGRPRLTWYGAGGERIELSGAVLANWVAKTTNLLVEEFDAAPGVRVGLDLPAHWRTAVWALAAWRCGAEVVMGGGVDDADVVVTDRPADHGGSRALVAVALPALARAFDGDLPPGAVDAAGAVMTYGDVVGWAPDVEPARAALTGPTGADAVAHAALADWATGAAGGPAAPGDRVLVEAGPDRGAATVALLRAVLAALVGDGSVVVLDAAVVAELAADPARRARLTAGERVTAG